MKALKLYCVIMSRKDPLKRTLAPDGTLHRAVIFISHVGVIVH